MSGNSAALAADCVHSVGGAVTTARLTLSKCQAVKTSAPVVRDPYATVPEPVAIGACQNGSVGSSKGVTKLTPTDNHPSGVKSMRFCNGLDLKGTVNFEPGLYIIEGGSLTINGGDLTSTDVSQLNAPGVTFYLTNGASLKLGGNAAVNLSAPTQGPFAGLLFFGSRTNAAASQTITGTSDSTLQGAIYMPGSDVQFTGNSSVTNGCTQVIGRTVTFSGNSSLGSSCEYAGARTIVTNESVTIVE
jgi:hypothetical protein